MANDNIQIHTDVGLDLLSSKRNKTLIKDVDPSFSSPETIANMGVEKGHAFSTIYASALEEVNAKLHDADAIHQQFQAGELKETHELTIAMDEAKKALQLMVQINYRLAEALKEVKSFQI